MDSSNNMLEQRQRVGFRLVGIYPGLHFCAPDSICGLRSVAANLSPTQVNGFVLATLGLRGSVLRQEPIVRQGPYAFGVELIA